MKSESDLVAAADDAVETRGLVLVNSHSASSVSDLDELRAAFSRHDVEACEPEHVHARVKAAVAERRPFVGIAGGDGTIRCAADVLVETDVALLAIPAGTHNHFAKALGLATLADAAAAAAGGHVATIDVAACNGSVFVNNSSIGAYPDIVEQREACEHRMPKPIANAIAVMHQLRAGRRILVEVDRRPRVAWLVFVGNGCYGESVTDLATRESLHDGTLDVRIVRADQRFARLRLILALVTGRLAESAVLERRTVRTITIQLRDRKRVPVALDGERELRTPPLRYEAMPDALHVIVPAPNA